MRQRDHFEELVPQVGNVFAIETLQELIKFHGILSTKFVEDQAWTRF